MKVVITGTERAKEEETDGGIAGLGIFKASGAITDQGTVTTYRGLTGPNDSVILLRFVTKGKSGRDHLHGEDRHDTEAGQTAMVDSSLGQGRTRGFRAGAPSPRTRPTPSAR